MEIHNAAFAGSFTELNKLPTDNKPEFAFVGRSNVGKSSWINTLCRRKGLAKTSSTPGKTQCLNYFLIDEKWHLVDLPGYGYARVRKGVRDGFQKMITDYCAKREGLSHLFILIDSRIPPQKIDQEFVEFAAEEKIPFSLLFTKIDKCKKLELNKSIEIYKKQIKDLAHPEIQMFLCSAEAKKGREEVLGFIGNLL